MQWATLRTLTTSEINSQVSPTQLTYEETEAFAAGMCLLRPKILPE